MTTDQGLRFVSIRREVHGNGVAKMALSTPTGRIREVSLWPKDLLKIIQDAAEAMALKEDDDGTEH